MNYEKARQDILSHHHARNLSSRAAGANNQSLGETDRLIKSPFRDAGFNGEVFLADVHYIRSVWLYQLSDADLPKSNR